MGDDSTGLFNHWTIFPFPEMCLISSYTDDAFESFSACWNSRMGKLKFNAGNTKVFFYYSLTIFELSLQTPFLISSSAHCIGTLGS